jgi:hypothetical protein
MDENTKDQGKAIEAKTAAVGETYLHATDMYRIKVLKRYGEQDGGEVTSILVESEADPLKPIAIAGGTMLLPYSEALHKPVAARSLGRRTTNHKKENRIDNKSTGKKSAPKTGVPRSSIIDKELLRYRGKEVPKWDTIAGKVISAKAAPESKRASVIAQAKVRYAWYSKGGKKNPAAAKAANK